MTGGVEQIVAADRDALVEWLIAHRDRDYAASVYKFTPDKMADDILTSDWLASLLADVRARALEEASDRMPAFHDRDVPEWAITSACRWLRERADRERGEATT